MKKITYKIILWSVLSMFFLGCEKRNDRAQLSFALHQQVAAKQHDNDRAQTDKEIVGDFHRVAVHGPDDPDSQQPLDNRIVSLLLGLKRSLSMNLADAGNRLGDAARHLVGGVDPLLVRFIHSSLYQWYDKQGDRINR